jgi:hypothetical protein
MSIANELSRLLQAKSDLATSIENKGVTVPAATTIDGYPALVDQIQQGGTPVLPYDEVEYLENNSNAYIDTGYKAGTNTRIVIRMMMVTAKRYAWGARTAANNKAFGFYGQDNNTKARWDYGNSILTGSFNCATNKIYTVANSSNIITVLDESTKTSYAINDTASTFTCDYNLFLFGVNQAGSYAATMTGKLYSCQIYDNNSLVRDYIPAILKATSKYGLWDKVNGVFYTSPNGTDFTGPDIT